MSVPVDVSTDRPLRIGICGAGRISAAHLPAFKQFGDRLHLAAVCDVRAEAAKALAASISPDVAVFTNLDEMLASGAIDAVDICTPHDLHAEQAIAAATAGRHVFVEKPMSCSVADSERMVAAAEAAGTTLMVGQVLRFLPGNAAARELIVGGDLGEIWSARADSWMPVTLLKQEPLGLDGWARDRDRAGGGVLSMLGTHHIDLFRYFFGEVAAVWARTWTDNPWFTNGLEDRAVATLQFRSGAVAHISCGYANRTPHLYQYMAFGDAGTLFSTLPPESQSMMTALVQHHAPSVVWNAEAEREGRRDFLPVSPCGGMFETDDPFINELLHFASCVRDGTEPLTSGLDNVATMKVLHACYESAATGGIVQLDRPGEAT